MSLMKRARDSGHGERAERWMRAWLGLGPPPSERKERLVTQPPDPPPRPLGLACTRCGIERPPWQPNCLRCGCAEHRVLDRPPAPPEPRGRDAPGQGRLF